MQWVAKGLSMSPENWNKLVDSIAFINEDIKTLQERLPPNQNGDESHNTQTSACLVEI